MTSRDVTAPRFPRRDDDPSTSQEIRTSGNVLELGPLEGATRLFFVRHAPVADEFADRLYGQVDVPLSPAGVRMSARMVFRLQSIPFRAIYSSDLQRTLLLADGLQRLFGVGLVKEPRLRERHYGAWHGKTWEEIRAQDGDALAEYHRDRGIAPPGGESFADTQVRVLGVIDEIVRRHVGDPIAIVTHAGVIRAAVAAALGLEPRAAFRFQLKPCSLTIIDYRNVATAGRDDPYVSLLNG